MRRIAMSKEKFMNLVDTRQGFEYIIGYRDDEDHIMGGKGDTYWYTIKRGSSVAETLIATYRDGVWQDRRIKGKGKRKTVKEMPSGTTIKRIVKEAYLAQDEKWVTGRKPSLIEDSHPHYHYVYGFGDKGLDVSAEYGVTIAYSDINNVPAGFHLRYLYTGADVEMPS